MFQNQEDMNMDVYVRQYGQLNREYWKTNPKTSYQPSQHELSEVGGLIGDLVIVDELR